MEYDAEGRQVATVDALNRRAVYKLDAAGRLVETVAPDGARTTLAYCADVSTQPCAEVDAEGDLTRREFDAEGRMVREVDPAGRVSTRVYSPYGMLVATSGPGEVPTQYVYDHRGLLTSVHTPGLRIDHAYDGRGNRTEVVAGGQRTVYTYDKNDRVLSETNPLGLTASYRYDLAGQRVAKVDANGRTTRYEYDRMGRLLKVLFEDGTAYTYAYDPAGRRTLEANAHHERRMRYDLAGRLAQVVDVTLGRTIDYGYDLEGNRTSLRTEGLEQRFAYDVRNRLVAAWHGDMGPLLFGSDKSGRRLWVKRPNGVRTDYTYGQVGQVKAIVHSKGAQVLQGFAYEYDARGLRTSKTYADGTRESYGYDEAQRLVSVDYGTQRSVRYTLDPLGNRLALTELANGQVTRSIAYTYNAFNQLLTATQTRPLPVSTTLYTYDRHGNLLSEMVAGQVVKSYTWDLDNRLRQVASSPGSTYSYQYDTEGLRIAATENGARQKYLLDGPHVLQVQGEEVVARQWVFYHPQLVDDLLGLETKGRGYLALSDALGSVQGLVDSSSSTMARQFSYDVYGWRETSGSGPRVAFGFSGREHEAWGVRYHRDRYVDESLGRWLQPDRLGTLAGSNQYHYAIANPVSQQDPSGMFAVTNSFDMLLFVNLPAWLTIALEIGMVAGGGSPVRRLRPPSSRSTCMAGEQKQKRQSRSV